MSKTVALDFAGYIYLITDAPSVAEVEAVAETNSRMKVWNAAYEIDQTPDDFNDSQAYPTTVISFAELASYERSGCEYDECHNLSFGPDYRSEKYCDDHAGSVTDEYWDVEETWEGSVVAWEAFTDYSDVEKFVRVLQNLLVRFAIGYGEEPKEYDPNWGNNESCMDGHEGPIVANGHTAECVKCGFTLGEGFTQEEYLLNFG